MQVITYGGIITTLYVPDKKGAVDDICLGFDTFEDYEKDHPYFGAIVGRVANRIAKGKFVLDGVTYNLPINHGSNSIHGGINGFDKKLWDATLDGSQLKLQYISKDGEEGYPGEVTVQVMYELTTENELLIDYTATTTKATPIMLVNHAYFNLSGHNSKDIYDHMAQINAERYLIVDEEGIPSGEIAPVEGTLFDLRKKVRLAERIKLINDGIGFDNNFCLDLSDQRKYVARVECPQTGRFLEVYSTEPAVQFYNSGYLDGVKGKGGITYGKHGAFCLEPQHYNDSVNQPSFPNTVLRPGETYRQTTWYRFGIVE
ncbi:galactose mutarotase-like [Liolophura sinensis]|uniref:galactose mutarotase-like n=1 Tax=Liolophura sinensis TaxID=3198878 RepID=UPI0031597A7E